MKPRSRGEESKATYLFLPPRSLFLFSQIEPLKRKANDVFEKNDYDEVLLPEQGRC